MDPLVHAPGPEDIEVRHGFIEKDDGRVVEPQGLFEGVEDHLDYRFGRLRRRDLQGNVFQKLQVVFIGYHVA